MQTWEQTYPLPSGTGVVVENPEGPVSVKGWGESTVKVAATSKDEALAERMEVTADDGGLSVQVRRPGGLFNFFDKRTPVALVVYVPTGTSCRVQVGDGAVDVQETQGHVEIETGSGAVHVAGTGDTQVETGSGAVNVRQVYGELGLETGSGSVNVEDVHGQTSVETGSGHVAVRRAKANLSVETGSGTLVIADVVGSAELETGSGSVTVERMAGHSLTVDTGGGKVLLRGIDVTYLEVDTSSGRVDAELIAIHPAGSYSVDTGSGGAEVAIPENADVSVAVESGSGRIAHTGLNLQVHHTEAGELEAQLGRGIASLTIDSGSGPVVLKALSAIPAVPAVPAVPVAPAVPAAPPVPPAPPMAPEARVLQAIQGDPALEGSDQVRRVLAMVESGKLTPDEAEAILRALDEEETPV